MSLNVDETNKLLKAAEGYKGTDHIREQLLRECMTDGYVSPEADDIVDNVLERLSNTEQHLSVTGPAMGKAQDPQKRYRHMVDVVQGLHSY
jgi:hypothetical protein